MANGYNVVVFRTLIKRIGERGL